MKKTAIRLMLAALAPAMLSACGSDEGGSVSTVNIEKGVASPMWTTDGELADPAALGQPAEAAMPEEDMEEAAPEETEESQPAQNEVKTKTDSVASE